MVTGRVIARGEILQPVAELFVYGQSDTRAHVHAVVDTGFTQHLTLPEHAITALKLRFAFEETLTMANDEPIEFDVYHASVDWNGATRTIEIHRAEGDPLIGMAMLRDHDLHVRAVPNGPVSIDPIA